MSSQSIDQLKEDCFKKITSLIENYQNNEYMLQRLKIHVVNYLQNSLENELKNHQKRIDRNTYLTNEQQTFIQVFLSKNQYFYLPTNNCFYEYKLGHYFIVKEDDILYNLLSSISKDRRLLQWKHKTKLNVIKLIRERNLFNSIPETDTIQSVLNILYPAMFQTKNQAKYFLTVIGDNILKKTVNFNFLVSQNMKKYLNELDNFAYHCIGNTSSTNNFVTKYHESQSYENYRLMNINELFSLDLWRECLKKYCIDLFCVAVHYSIRHESSDNYLMNNSDEDFKNYALFLKNNSAENIVSDFLNKKLQHIVNTSANCDNEHNNNNTNVVKIEWKYIHFIWKQYLSNLSLPNIIYTNTLKNIIKTIKKEEYDEQNDCLLNHISRFLPIESDFILFWEQTINEDTNSSNSALENELEVDELCFLFKSWVKSYNINNHFNENKIELLSNGNISEENMLKILRHFFSNIEIVEDKYILNVTCILWDKNKDIEESFKLIKPALKDKLETSLISFDELYGKYCQFCKAFKKNVVSKRYFEKYLYYILSEYIVHDKFVDVIWLEI